MATTLLEFLPLSRNSDSTPAIELDPRELVEQVDRLTEEVQVLRDVLDEVREEIATAVHGYQPDDWRPVPPRPIGSIPVDLTVPDVAERFNDIESDKSPGDLSENVRTAVAVRLRESQSQGVDSLTHQKRPEETNSDLSASGNGHSVQQSLWDAAKEPSETAVVATENGSGEERREKEAPKTPYSLDAFQEFQQQRSGSIAADAWKAHFQWLVNSKDSFITDLVSRHSATQLKVIALRCGVLDAGRNNKRQNAQSIYQKILTSYTLGALFSYQPLSETIEEAARRQVEAITEEAIAEERARIVATQAENEKAVTHPETLLEFRRFVDQKGLDALTDEQFATRDALYAQLSRKTRQEARQTDSVEQFQSAEISGLAFSIIEGFHDKKQVPLHIVRIATRVERATFNELKIKAKQLGGWWSSFKKATAGFQFVTREAADKFVRLTQDNADSSQEQLAKKLYKMDNASERLQAVAETLETSANAILAADESKLKNTLRRASMAANQRGQAFNDLAAAKTLRSISSTLADGGAKYLDRIWNAKQIQTLKQVLWQAQQDRIRHQLANEGLEQRGYGWNRRYDALEGESYQAADVRHAKYPTPYLYKQHLVRAIGALRSTPGVKQISAKMQKLVNRAPDGQDSIEFTREHEVALLEEFVGRAKAAGDKVTWFDHCLDSTKRLRAANIYTDHELRMALQELIPHLSRAAGDDPVTRVEDELRGKQLDGFFPTPRAIIERMLERADIQPADRVLEPSAGKGDILDMIRREHPDVSLTAIERNLTLQDILTAKGHGETVEFGDFLEHQGEYERIVMNPPFGKGEDIDHVRHAYEVLAPGGRLVSVMCKGPFFRSDSKSNAFREWLESLEHDVDELPEDAFQGAEAFRQTGVQTAIVTIDKPE